jgi:hypothetical protein
MSVKVCRERECDVRSSKRQRSSDEEVSSFGDVSRITALLTPAQVGRRFTIMYSTFEDKIEGWQCGAILRAVHLSTNGQPEFSFIYESTNSDGLSLLSNRIVAPDSHYWLFPFEGPNPEVPRYRIPVCEDVKTMLVALGNQYLGDFGDYEAVRQHLGADKVGTQFVVLHRNYSGWAAYEAVFKGVVEGLVPQFEFEYDNSGAGPYVSTDDSQLPDSQLPRTRLGAHLNYFLFSN